MKNHGHHYQSLDELIKPMREESFPLPDGIAMPGDGHGGHHHEGLKSVREEHYKGKHIRIETHYTITIDGEPVTIHMEVMNNGRVHCHTLPQYSTPSAVGIIKAMIDAEADVAQPTDELADEPDHDAHSEHDEHNTHHHGG